MALAIQLNLFEKNDDISILYRELENAAEEHEKLRRSLFGRHGDLMKLYALQQQEIMQIKRFLIENQGATLSEFTPSLPEPKPRKKRTCKAA